MTAAPFRSINLLKNFNKSGRLFFLKNYRRFGGPTDEQLIEYKATGNTVNSPYDPDADYDEFAFPTKRQYRTGWKYAKEEFLKWVEERKEAFRGDPITEYNCDEVIRVFSFGRGEDPSTWSVANDSTDGFGYSTCNFTTSNNGCALFQGNLSTQIVHDGVTHRSGYCGIRAPKPKISFCRKTFYDWSQFTHLVLRVRGDGRSYMINLGARGTFDTTWFNLHSYCLFTRGGPYWQISKIPFSKFILTHKGYIQDKQWEPSQDEISSFGITLMDGVDGPFQLEIDYIGLELKLEHEEEHAYEMYKHVPYLGDC